MDEAPKSDVAAGKRTEETRREAAERRLDEALAETFPASDPVSMIQPAVDEDGRGDDDPAAKPASTTQEGGTSGGKGRPSRTTR